LERLAVLMPGSSDVVVVGGGGSGLAAAVSAAEHGLSVVVLEKHARLGGTTGIAVGSFTANRTSLQSRAGVDDDLDAHAEDAAKFAPPDIEAANNDAMRRFFLSHACETLDWLMRMGLTFHGPSPEPPNRAPRMHNVVPNAKAYIAALQSRLLQLGGRIQCNAAVDELLIRGGQVIGVAAKVDQGRCEFLAQRGVILAAGDYANSAELITQYKGERFAAIEGINPHAAGDGHRLALSAGARLMNMDVTYGPEIRFVAPTQKGFVQLLPSGGPLAWLMGRLLPVIPRAVINRMIKRLLVTWQHPENALFDDGAILLNQRGERFCDETVWPDREIAIARQPGKVCYILLDQGLIERYSQWPHFISTAPEIAYAYVSDYLRLRPDVAVEGRSLSALAAARNIPPDCAEQAVQLFNRQVAAGEADPWGRRGARHVLEGDRWVLLGPAKAWFTTTEGGAAINERFEVLDEQGLKFFVVASSSFV